MKKIRWEYVMEYSKDINSLLGNPKSVPTSAIEDPKTVLKVNLRSFMLVFSFQIIFSLYGFENLY